MTDWTLAEHVRRLYWEQSQLSDRFKEVERRLEELSQQLAEQRNAKSYAVEKIEYRFDQLKIETLQGTLHIGLKPGGSLTEPGGEWSLGNVSLPDPVSPSYPNIHGAVHRYITESVPASLSRQCADYGYRLDNDEMNRVIADLRGQVDARIIYYLKNARPDDNGEPAKLEQEVIERTLRDVDTAVRTFAQSKQKAASKEEKPS